MNTLWLLGIETKEWTEILKALQDTLYMTFGSGVLAILIGFAIGVLLWMTSSDGFISNKIVNTIADVLVNIFRAVPFIILMFLLLPLAKLLTGSWLGASAAIPSLVFAAAPFYARMCLIAFTEVDKGTLEAAKAMGASPLAIIFKVLLPESLPALVSACTVTAINLVGYTAMAGAIGSGGLGNLAYLYGFSRHNNAILYTATALIVVLVFVIQWIGDRIVRKIDKR